MAECCLDPDLADDREPDDRSASPQFFNAGGRIPEERLTGKIKSTLPHAQSISHSRIRSTPAFYPKDEGAAFGIWL
jgi:hypothetical protein